MILNLPDETTCRATTTRSRMPSAAQSIGARGAPVDRPRRAKARRGYPRLPLTYAGVWTRSSSSAADDAHVNRLRSAYDQSIVNSLAYVAFRAGDPHLAPQNRAYQRRPLCDQLLAEIANDENLPTWSLPEPARAP